MKWACLLSLLFITNTSFWGQTNKQLDSILLIETKDIQANSSKAIKLLKFALNAPRAKKEISTQAKIHSLLSLAYYYNGNYSSNLESATKSMRLYSKIKDYENLAYLYGEFGFRIKVRSLLQGESYMQKGMNLALKHGFENPLKSIYNNYGIIKLSMNQQDSALLYFNKALDLSIKHKDSIGIPFCYNHIGDFYLKTKNYKHAEINFLHALDFALKIDNPYVESDTYAYLGDLFLAKKMFLKAVEYYQKSLAIAEKQKIANLISHNYKMLAYCYEANNDLKNALHYTKTSQAFNDSILNIETQSKMIEFQTKFDTAEKEKEILNQQVISNQRQFTIFILISLILLVLFTAFMIYKALRRKNIKQKQDFELKETLAKVESIQRLHNQRVEISKDLHDNIGAQLTFIISSMEMIKYKSIKLDEQAKQHLEKIEDFARGTIAEFRDTVWAINRPEISMEDMKNRISNLLSKANSAIGEVTFEFEIDDSLHLYTFSSHTGMNVFRILQEAVNNAIKYAKASLISIKIFQDKNEIVFTVQDNGTGFEITEIEKGNGLHNMEKRANEINGNFSIQSSTVNGTKVELIIAL